MRHFMRGAIGACLITALPVQAIPVFINEIHYDNAGADQGEAVELAGPAGTDLSGWRLVLYNGGNGMVYNSLALNGIIPDQQAGFGTLSFAATGLQNGAPDGIALVDGSDLVMQFISYEGELTATDGPAAGQNSHDIGIAEGAASAVGESLQLIGSGLTYADFTWIAGPSSFGTINIDQVFLSQHTTTPTIMQAIPEPATLTLFGLSLFGLCLHRSRVGKGPDG